MWIVTSHVCFAQKLRDTLHFLLSSTVNLKLLPKRKSIFEMLGGGMLGDVRIQEKFSFTDRGRTLSKADVVTLTLKLSTQWAEVVS